jgi:hypothetical protein
MVSLTRPSQAIHDAVEPSCETAKAVTKGLGLFGIVLVGVAVVTAIALIPDISRYIRMKTM